MRLILGLPIYLYSQTYITWSPGCDSNDKINKEHILEQAVGSVGVASSLFTTFMISIVFFIVSVIFVCTHECRKSEADGYEVKKHTNVELLCVSIKIVFASIIIWLCYKSISVINSYTSSVGQIGKSKCSDNYTNEIFLSFSKALYSSIDEVYFSIGVSATILVVCTFFTIMLLSGKLIKEDSNKYYCV